MPKISALPPVVGALLTDIVPAVQAGVTVKESLQQVLNLFNSNIVIAESQVTNLVSDLAARLIKTNNLSDLTSASTARTNLGLGTAAVQNIAFFLQTANNLSDVPSAATARTNLGLGSAATQSSAFFLQVANNLSDLASATTARTNLGLGTAAVQNVAFFLQTANNLSDVPSKPTALTNLGGLAIANNLSDVANAATSRTNLGLGTAATHPATDFLLVANNLSDLNNAGTARTNLGLGSAATQAQTFFLQVGNNLSDLNNASTARTNLGLGSAAIKAASGAGGTVASVTGTFTIGHVATFADTSGTIQDGGATSQFLLAANNLSDVASASISRTNLGLGTAAVKTASGAGSTVASVTGAFTAGHFAVFADTVGTIQDGGTAPGGVLLAANNLSDVNSASTSRTNLGLGTAAVKAASGAGGTVASVTGSFTAGHVATFADTVGTIQDGGGTTGSGSFVLGTSPTITTPNIVGTTTNNNAAAGSVGEVISSTILLASAVSLANGTAKDVTTISLTAGDWDVYGNVFFNVSTSATLNTCWISTTSATLPDAALRNTIGASVVGPTGINVPYSRLSLGTTTTVYLSGLSNFSTGTNTGSGQIYARRIR